jgi:hypothetical protein
MHFMEKSFPKIFLTAFFSLLLFSFGFAGGQKPDIGSIGASPNGKVALSFTRVDPWGSYGVSAVTYYIYRTTNPADCELYGESNHV